MRACLVVDLQRDFFSSGSLAEAQDGILHKVNAAVRYFRAEAVPIGWVRTLYKPDWSDLPHHMRIRQTHILREGSGGAELLSGLEVEDSDALLVKKHFSVCRSPDILAFLASSCVCQVTFIGVNTHECILFSAIDLYQDGYFVHVPEDCVWSYDQRAHEYALDYLSKRVHSTKPIRAAELGAYLNGEPLSIPQFCPFF